MVLVSIPDKGNQQERGQGRTSQRESLQDTNQAEKSHHTQEGAARRRQLMAGAGVSRGEGQERGRGEQATSARHPIGFSVPRAVFTCLDYF